MPDKKFAPAYIVQPQAAHVLSDEMRDALRREFGKDFTSDDFAEMSEALDRALAAYQKLRAAPHPRAITQYGDKVGRAARALRALLDPAEQPPNPDAALAAALEAAKADPMETPVPTAARTAAYAARSAVDQLKYLAFPDPQTPGVWDDRSVEEFRDALSRLSDAAARLHPLIEGETVSERGTAHLLVLVRGLTGVGARHGLDVATEIDPATGMETATLKYRTVDTLRQSRLCHLAFRIAELLPEAARPTSGPAVVEQVVRALTAAGKRDAAKAAL